MFQPWTFGYVGRPSNGRSGLATLYDASADYSVNKHSSVGFYYGYAAGKPVIQSTYPSGRNATSGTWNSVFDCERLKLRSVTLVTARACLGPYPESLTFQRGVRHERVLSATRTI